MDAILNLRIKIWSKLRICPTLPTDARGVGVASEEDSWLILPLHSFFDVGDGGGNSLGVLFSWWLFIVVR